MQFMRNEAKIKEFSRRSAADTFIDATGCVILSIAFVRICVSEHSHHTTNVGSKTCLANLMMYTIQHILI